MTAGQWEQYVEPAAKVMHRERFGPDIPWGDFGPVMEEMELTEARAMLEAVGPRIAEDTRDRLVAAAGVAVERQPMVDTGRLATWLRHEIAGAATQREVDAYESVLRVVEKGAGLGAEVDS